MAGGLHFLIDEQDLAVLANVESNPVGELLVRVEDPQSRRRLPFGIAEDGVVGLKGFGEFLVQLRFVRAGGKIGDTGVPEGFAILTE